MKKFLSLVLIGVLAMGSLLGLTACDNKSTPMTVCVGPYPDTIDPALNSAVDGATYIIHAFSGLVGFEQSKDGKLELYADCAKALPEGKTRDDGMVEYTFELRDGLKWNDGTELNADDFIYAWNRAIAAETAADYEYMFDVIDGYADAKLNVTASEDKKSLTVVLPVDVPYFLELCAFPTFMPVKKSVVDGKEAWATKAKTYIGNGPYKVTKFTQSQLIMEKNEHYHNADKIVTEKIAFPFNGDDGSLIANYKNGAYKFIDSVPNEEIDTLKKDYPEEFKIDGQLGTYYISFNVNDVALKDFTPEEKTKIRLAMGLLIDRNYIVKEIGKAGQVPAAGFVAMGLTEPDGQEFIAKNGPDRDGKGYFSTADEDYNANTEKALALFKEAAESSGKFTVEDKKLAGFPTLTYITNEGTGHEAIATYLQGVYDGYGLTMKVEVQEWNTFLNTRKNGDYSFARNGWLGDYNDPISFLDMWLTTSGNNDSQFGKDDHAKFAGFTVNGETGKTWAESYDKIITEVKTSKDAVKRFELMHEAEDILMSTGAICPIYYYTDIYMVSEDIKGFFSSPLGFKYFMYATVDEVE